MAPVATNHVDHLMRFRWRVLSLAVAASVVIAGCSRDACEQARREALQAHHDFATAQEAKLDSEAKWEVAREAGRAVAGCPSGSLLPWTADLPSECRQWLESGELPKPDSREYDTALRALRIANHAVESVCAGLPPD